MTDRKVTVRAPATSANMGPGFDCLGLALDIWNVITVEAGIEGFHISGQGEDELPRDKSNMVWQSIARVFEETGRPMPPLTVTCRNDIPTARGLGSSSAALVGGLTAGNELCGRPFSQADLLQIAAEVEGHPDNVAPALFGGMQIAVYEGDSVINASVPVLQACPRCCTSQPSQCQPRRRVDFWGAKCRGPTPCST